PRTAAAAATAPFLWRAIVSALVQPAKSTACLAFISSSICVVKCGSAWPLAIVVMIWPARRHPRTSGLARGPVAGHSAARRTHRRSYRGDEMASDELLRDYPQMTVSTIYHPVGTAHMAPDGDAGA